MKNLDEQALDILRGLSKGVNTITGELYSIDSPYMDSQIQMALNTAINSLREKMERLLLPNAGQPWGAEEELKLINDFDFGKTVYALAKQHGRTEGGIRARLIKAGRLQPSTKFN